MSRLHLSTNPGLESLLVQDLQERGPAGRAEHLPQAGWVAWETEAPLQQMLEVARGCRVAHHVHRPVTTLELEPAHALSQVRDALSRLHIAELEPEGTRFRVTGTREGEHPFTSVELASAAGAGIRDRIDRPVRMRGYDVDVHVHLRGTTCQISVRHTREPLSRWLHRPYTPRVSLHPGLAWALLRLASRGGKPRGYGSSGGEAPGAILDPFCGAGTILLVAGELWPNTRLCGSDISPPKVAGARENLDAHGLLDRADLRQGDARQLTELWAGHRFDAVVTNPPFGKQLGADTNFDRLYWRLLSGLVPLTPPGTPVLVLVHKRGPFKRALREVGAYELVHARVVDMGGVFPVIYLLRRTSEAHDQAEPVG